ncbi:glycosyltransferase [Nonomuraea sp. NPDC049152]|uniref:glycosyltransferase n=1 Tax=Nonomuraea sp. NPDC049152 TaxID=3154350 RepID=UPI0033EA6D9A
MSPRVLHVTQPVDGGVGAYVAAVAADQVRRGWQVAVACPEEGPLRERLAELEVPWLDWPVGRSPGPRDLAAIRRLGRLIAAFGPDAVHLHSAKAGLVGRAAIRGRIPTLFQPHGWSWLAARGPVARAALAWERRAARWADLLVCVGEGESVLAQQNGVRGNLVVVRNGVDLRRFHPADKEERATARERHGVLWSAPLAVCVGRITRQKGQDLLLSAWELVMERCGEARLAIVGDGDLFDELRSLDTPGVQFVGAVADARPWYAAADVVVLPSRWEGLPLTALEAMATGRSLVVYDVPGLTEVVGEGTGAAVPAEDVLALAEALLFRFAQPGLAAAEGRAAAARSASFDVAVAFGELAEHTLRLVGLTAPAAAGGVGGGAGTGFGTALAGATAAAAAGGVGGGAGIGFGTAGLSATCACAARTGAAGVGVNGLGVSGAGVKGVGVYGAVMNGASVTVVPAGGMNGAAVDGAVVDGVVATELGVSGLAEGGVGVPEAVPSGLGVDGDGVATGGVGVTGACGRNRLRNSADERGFDEHCQTPCGQ